METFKDAVTGEETMVAPYSLGKLIEWKQRSHRRLRPNSRLLISLLVREIN